MGVKLEVDVLADIIKAQQEIIAFERAGLKTFKKVKGGVDRASLAMRGLRKTASFLKSNIVALGASIGGLLAIREVTRSFLEFTSAAAEVATISEEVAANQSKFNDAFIESAAQFGTSAADQAKVFYQIVSAGITDTVRANETLIAANKLAIGGLAGTAESVDILTSAVNAYGQENLSATRASDILFTTVRLGKTTISELASSLGTVLPSSNALGVSFEDVAGALAALTTRGVSTSEAVTQLNAIFTAVLKKQGEAKKLLGDNADAFSLLSLRTKGLTKFLIDLDEATGGSEEKLVKLLGRAEGARAIITLAADGFKTLGDNIKSLGDESIPAADLAFAKIQATIGQQLKILKAQIFEGIILKFFVENEAGITEALTSVNDFIRAIREGSPEAAAQIRFLGSALAAAFLIFRGPALLASITSTYGTLITLNRAAAVAALSLRAALTAVKIAATFGLAFLLDGLIELVTLFNAARDSGQGFAAALTTTFTALGLKIGNLILNFNSLGLAIFKGLLDQLAKIPILGDKLKGVTAAFQDGLKRNQTQIDKNNKALGELLKTQQKITTEEGKRVGGGAGGGGKPKKPKPKEEQKTNEAAAAAGIAAGIIAGAQRGGKEGAFAVAQSFSQALGPTAGPIVGAAVAAAQFLAQGSEAVKQQLGSLLDSIPDILVGVIDGAIGAVEVLLEKVPLILEKIIGRIPEILTRLIPALGRIFGRVLSDPAVGRGVARSIVRNMPAIIDALKEGMKQAAIEFKNELLSGQAVKDVGSGGGGVFGGLGFATGLDRVPSGFNNDNFPAGLSSGEGVITAANNNRIDAILRQAEQGGGTQRVTINVMLQEDVLATALVELDRRGVRTVA